MIRQDYSEVILCSHSLTISSAVSETYIKADNLEINSSFLYYTLSLPTYRYVTDVAFAHSLYIWLYSNSIFLCYVRFTHTYFVVSLLFYCILLAIGSIKMINLQFGKFIKPCILHTCNLPLPQMSWHIACFKLLNICWEYFGSHWLC